MNSSVSYKKLVWSVESKSKLVLKFLTVLVLMFLVSIPVSADNSTSEEKRVIIVYHNPVSEYQTSSLENDYGASITHRYDIIPAVAAKMNENAINHIKSRPNVKAIFEDQQFSISLDDSVPQINASQTHNAGVNGSGVRVCVLDTGVDDSHSALNQLVAEYDFVNGDNDSNDDNGHGTHVAGIIGSTDSTYRGVAYNSSIMAGKVLNSSGVGYSSDIISGIEWCVDNNADVISMSFGTGSYSSTCDGDPVSEAANNASDHGVTVLAASGNDEYSNSINLPACASNVIAVGAVDKDDSHASYSNGGSELDVVAPGSNIYSTWPGDSFNTKSGTSMATPHTSGTSALILETNNGLSPIEVRDILRNTSVDLGDEGFDNEFGYGRIDAYAAYQAASHPSCTAIDSCGSYETSDTCYYLSQDISTSNTGECIKLEGDNVTLYGDGYTISGPGSSGTGIKINGTVNVTIRDLTTTEWNRGIHVDGSDSKVVDVTSTSNYCGIYLEESSNTNVSYNNFSYNTNNGINIEGASGIAVFNNVFNNSNNSNIQNTGTNNHWNTSNSSGPNIIGGPFMGGNAWLKPDGSGFSQTCSDTDDDGFCDSQLELASDNVDYLPLASASDDGGSSSSSSNEVYVDDDFDSTTDGWGTTKFAKIQHGIDNVSVDGIVHVADGIYYEHVLVDNNVTLVSDNPLGAIIKGNSSMSVNGTISITANNATINGFKMREYYVPGGGKPVINVSGSYVTVKNMDLLTEGNYTSGAEPTEITVRDTTTDAEIINNTIKADIEGHPSIMVSGDNALVEENTIDQCDSCTTEAVGGIGVSMNSGYTVTIKNNSVSHAYDEGIWLTGASGNIYLTGNTVNNYDLGGNNVEAAVKIVDEPATFNGFTNPVKGKEDALNNNSVDDIYLQWLDGHFWVDDDWSGSSYGDEVETGKYYGENAFDNIQIALDNVTGSTVTVNEGTYNEDLSITTDGLVLEGANKGISAGSCSGTRGAESVINGSIDVSVSNVTIDGLKVINGGSLNGDTAGIYLRGSTSNHSVVNNIIEGDNTGRGVLVGSSVIDVEVKDNEIYNWTTGIYLNPSSNILVDGNRIHDTTAGIGSDGINDVTVVRNNFTANDEGWGYSDDAGSGGSNLVAERNNFVGNNYGIMNYNDSDIIIGKYNWWGDSSGPGGAGPGSGDNVSANVDYEPWMDEPIDTCDVTPPDSVANLGESNYGSSFINWTWSNPTDLAFVEIYLNGNWMTKTSHDYYNATGLSSSTSYELGTRTVDDGGNVNYTWVNDTATTASDAGDTTPPDPVSNVVNTTGNFWINWTWDNPTSDYNHTEVWVDGVLVEEYNTKGWYNGSYSAHATKEVGLRTVDSSGNKGSFVNQSTTIPNNPITLMNVADSYSIAEGDTLYIDAEHSDADGDTGTYSTNATKGSFDSGTGELTWSTGTGDEGTYTWEISVSDGYGSSDQQVFTVNVASGASPTAPSNIQVDNEGDYWLNWTWDKGDNSDYTEVWIDGVWQEDSGDNVFNYSTSAHARHTIGLREYNSTVDEYSPWNNDTATVANNPIYITNVSASYSLERGDTLYIDADHENKEPGDTILFSTNGTYDSFNCFSGEYIWETGVGDEGNYTWYISVSDGYGSSDRQVFTVDVFEMGPPGSVSGLDNVSYALSYVNWTWDDPADYDFDHVEVYLDGVWQANVSKGVESFNATGLSTGTSYEISTRTVDSNGNVNETWVNDTARTAAPPSIVEYSPGSPVRDVVNDTRTFSINVDQGVDVSWYVNGTLVQTNSSVTSASYTDTAELGTWDVSATVSNEFGTDSQSWTWYVENETVYDYVSYWRFDENSGSTAYDVTGKNNGTIHGASWSSGGVNSSLYFSGNDYVDCGSNSSLDITGEFTISTWIKPTQNSKHATILAKEDYPNNKGYLLHQLSGTDLMFRLYDGTNKYTLEASNQVSTNNWQHIVATYDGSEMKLYKNGTQIASRSGPSSIATTTQPLYIGDRSTVDQAFQGTIDETQIYDRALSATEIEELYNSSSSYITSAPAYSPSTLDLEFEENEGSTTYDATSNNNDGNINGATWTSGSIGSALSFDRNDYVDCGSDSSLDITNELTISTWIKPTQNSKHATILAKEDYPNNKGYLLHQLSGTDLMFRLYDGTNKYTLEASNQVSTNNWQHIVATYDGSEMKLYKNGTQIASRSGPSSIATTTQPLYIGDRSTVDQAFQGTIDETQIYDRALSASEIEELYSIYTMPSTLDLEFEENEGSTTYDATSNNNDGNINGATWTSGSIGSALSFDRNDYVDCGSDSSLDITNELTISTWIKPTQNSKHATILAKEDYPNNKGYLLHQLSGTNLMFRLYDGTNKYTLKASNSVSTNNWQHIVATYDGTTMKLYKNGTQIASMNGPTTIATTTQPLYIGDRTTVDQAFQGTIDETQIYNKALSAGEVEELHNQFI